MDWKINNKRRELKGKVPVPADKSISHRAAMFAAISDGLCRIDNFLFSEDCLNTVEALKKTGAVFRRTDSGFVVEGVGMDGLKSAKEELDLGNSGTSMRILPGLFSGQGISVVLTGDDSLKNRPMGRIISPLLKMGANIKAMGAQERPPIRLLEAEEKLKAIDYNMPVASAQVKSCVLSAALYAEAPSRVTEPFVSRDHTERMLSYMGIKVEKERSTTVIHPGCVKAKDISVPGDLSSAAFFIVAGLILPNSQVYMDKVGINPTRAGVLNVLQRMGGQIILSDVKEGMESSADIQAVHSKLKGTVIKPSEIPILIDEVPILAVAAAFAEGQTVFESVSELKVKESDRVRAVLKNFQKFGIKSFETDDKLFIQGDPKRKIEAAQLESFKDHRMAMAMAVCAMACEEECLVKDVSCVKTSFPDFYECFKNISQR